MRCGPSGPQARGPTSAAARSTPITPAGACDYGHRNQAAGLPFLRSRNPSQRWEGRPFIMCAPSRLPPGHEPGPGWWRYRPAVGGGGEEGGSTRDHVGQESFGLGRRSTARAPPPVRVAPRSALTSCRSRRARRGRCACEPCHGVHGGLAGRRCRDALREAEEAGRRSSRARRCDRFAGVRGAGAGTR